MHCGFCLPACPTYTRLGDEADSPRGRLHLMQAVAEGRLDAGSNAFQTHLDRCLGCRACEPVCPAGVPYGSLLEQARSVARTARPTPPLTRSLLRVFASRSGTRWALAGGRLLRASGIAGLLARWFPRAGQAGVVQRGMAMLAGSRAWRPERLGSPGSTEDTGSSEPPARLPAPSPPREMGAGDPVALLRGCVQTGLFQRVQAATAAILEVNGCTVRECAGQGCCGALHAHAGDLEGARRLARRNIEAFEAEPGTPVVVDAAGCSAAMRDYGHWLAREPGWARRADGLAARVVDVTAFLAARDVRRGAPLEGRVALHPPCHLHHAQDLGDAPRRVLEAAVPGLELARA
ncbi:MAG: 4Fe-4S dicluster domain-containing protein, partial [Gemmatimonadetes bacterium]|nr:4Fe-4S dicluster domain-containing protein [Gemmatimonadota bacterium]